MADAAAGTAKRTSGRDIDVLIKDLADDNHKVRRAAVDALAKIGGDRAARLISSALDDPRKQVRSRAALCLGKLGRRDSLGILASALQDRTASVRKEAVGAIGKIGNAGDALNYLLPMLRDPDSTVVYKTIEVFGAFRDSRMVEPLLTVVGTRESGLQKILITSLGQFRDLRTIPFLTGMLKTGAPGVPPFAARELSQMGDNRSLPRFLIKARDLPAKFRLDALEALRTVKFRYGGWFQPLVLAYNLPPILEYCERVVVSDEDPEVRRGARHLIDYSRLLRGSKYDSGSDVLLRAASGSSADQGDLLIGASEEAVPRAARQPSLWRRLFFWKT